MTESPRPQSVLMPAPSTRPQLHLTTMCLSPATATRQHLAAIEAVMLWPDDEKLRASGFHAADAQFLLENRALLLARQDVDWLRYLADAPRIGDIHVRDPYAHGVIAGYILHDTVGKIILGLEDASIGKSIATCSQGFWRRFRVSEKTINNVVWPRYKPVAHFWAAYFSNYLAGDTVWPCDVSKISQFLAEAEAYREFGETLKPFKSRHGVIPPDIAVRLPFAIEKARLEFTTALST